MDGKKVGFVVGAIVDGTNVGSEKVGVKVGAEEGELVVG